jgi:hypothetical protein
MQELKCQQYSQWSDVPIGIEKPVDFRDHHQPFGITDSAEPGVLAAALAPKDTSPCHQTPVIARTGCKGSYRAMLSLALLISTKPTTT